MLWGLITNPQWKYPICKTAERNLVFLNRLEQVSTTRALTLIKRFGIVVSARCEVPSERAKCYILVVPIHGIKLLDKMQLSAIIFIGEPHS